ncbi:amino acid/amide ABC transporter ATP-binding protein 1, HAAT family [Pyrobaculum islandicum DSM 4184]|uniref:Probable branched-chain amino acid transport ATP-binding protein LivG n=1 Tax=Pyrobaculum islandicum (strain DSM 4184 / JCM 9189 / GEO3) TaxID=384616 RepID=A1RS39_PYRIL|nr:ABC transporter ATP-binding protein [Pyrobaculum islandicum]ABL87771.1 amino acid/amide ABC transporter ATP-binding protein 1, HAAT family [Pyrobaculum islandicum DSM 4184]
MVLLVTKGIVKQFGAFRALDGVDVEIEKGRVTLIIGPNGSGKTTLVNVITGVYKPEAGRVFYTKPDGKMIDITGWPPHKIFEIGIVRTFQIPQIFQKLTVLENLLAVARGQRGESVISALLKNWVKEEEELARRAFGILKAVRLIDKWDVPAYLLSAGEMKLLELARALMAGANLIILDEPIAGVPVDQAHEVFKIVRDINKQQNVTFLVIEHRIDIAFKYVDYVYAMASGKVIAKGLPEEVANDPKVKEVYIGG